MSYIQSLTIVLIIILKTSKLAAGGAVILPLNPLLGYLQDNELSSLAVVNIAGLAVFSVPSTFYIQFRVLSSAKAAC